MDTFDVIKMRRSVRLYKSKKISDEILYAIFDAAHTAPAAGNITNWRFLVIEDEYHKKLIARAALNQYWIAQAPIVILVCSEHDAIEREYGKRGKELYSIQNVAAAVENLLLAAQNFGVASCWAAGAFAEAQLRKEFEIPDYVEIHAIVTLGYANEKPVAPSRPPFADVLYFEKYYNSGRGAAPKTLGEHAEEISGKVTKKAKHALKSMHEKIKRKIKRK